MSKKRLSSLLCALFLLIAVFPFSLFAVEGRTDSLLMFDNGADVNLIVNGTSITWSANFNAVTSLSYDFNTVSFTKHSSSGVSEPVVHGDSLLVGFSVDFGDNIPTGHTVESVTVDYYCDYFDPAGVSHRYTADTSNAYVNNAGVSVTCNIPVDDCAFITDKANDFAFTMRVNVTTSSSGGGTTPTPTNTNVAYVFDELLVYMDGVLEDGWTFGGIEKSILVKKPDGSYFWKSSDGLNSGNYVGSEDLEFTVIPPSSHSNYNFVLESGTYRYFDTKTTTDKYTVPVSWDSNHVTGLVTWHYVEGTEGHGILTLRFNSVASDTKTYSITSSSAGFSYDADLKKPYGTQVVADGQGEFTLYALPYNGKYPRYAEIKNNSGKLLTRVDMTKFDDTAFYCMLPDYGETCIVYIVYSDEVNSDYTNGYNAGYQQGLKDGANDGSYKEGYDEGFAAGLNATDNPEGWLDFFDGVFGSLIFNAVYVLSGIGFGDISLLDVIVIGFFAFVTYFVIKKLVN